MIIPAITHGTTESKIPVGITPVFVFVNATVVFPSKTLPATIPSLIVSGEAGAESFVITAVFVYSSLSSVIVYVLLSGRPIMLTSSPC